VDMVLVVIASNPRSFHFNIIAFISIIAKFLSLD